MLPLSSPPPILPGYLALVFEPDMLPSLGKEVVMDLSSRRDQLPVYRCLLPPAPPPPAQGADLFGRRTVVGPGPGGEAGAGGGGQGGRGGGEAGGLGVSV